MEGPKKWWQEYDGSEKEAWQDADPLHPDIDDRHFPDEEEEIGQEEDVYGSPCCGRAFYFAIKPLFYS